MNCRLCDTQETQLLLDLGQQPISHHYLKDPDDPEATYPFVLIFCAHCGLVQLQHPISEKLLYQNYTYLTSHKPQPHIQTLLHWLQKHAALTLDTTLIEVGSNDGIFLNALKQAGFTHLLGIEPAQDACQTANRKGLKTLHQYFNQTTARQLITEYGAFEVFIARQMLEHIGDLSGFGKAMQSVLRPGSYVLIEVPDFSFALDYVDYSALWEAHVNHFTLTTLTRYLGAHQIQVQHHFVVNFSGQALVVLAQYQPDMALPQVPITPAYQARVAHYRAQFSVFKHALTRYLHQLAMKHLSIAIYGAGNRTILLLNFFGLRAFYCVYDDDPHKIGLYLPGSRLPIYAGHTLDKQHCDLCLLAVNAENEDRMISQHREFLQQGGEFLSLHPPSERLLPFWKTLAHAV